MDTHAWLCKNATENIYEKVIYISYDKEERISASTGIFKCLNCIKIRCKYNHRFGEIMQKYKTDRSTTTDKSVETTNNWRTQIEATLKQLSQVQKKKKPL